MRFCNHCGKPVSEGNQFCDYCGAELRAGSNTVPGGSPFRPAADFDTQYAPASQPGDNGFSAPGNIGAPEGSFHKLRLPSQWSEPSTALEARVPANRTFSDLKFGRNSQHSPDPAPAKKKSPVKRIIAAVLVIVILAGFSSYFAMEKLRQDNSSGTVKNAEEAIAYMAEMSDTYGYQNAASELTEKNTSTIDGDTYYRLQQNYHGIPVYGRTAVYVTDEAGNQIAVTGNLCDVDESISLTPTITQEEAEKSIIDYISDDFDNTNISDITISKITDDSLCIYNMSDSNVTVLAYIVNVSISYGEQGTLAYECTVDSQDASVLKLICTTLSENVLLPAIQDSEGDETSIEVSEVNIDGTKYYELVDEERRIKIYSANKHLLEYEVYWDGMLCLNSNDSDCYNKFYDSLSTDQKRKFGKENWSNVTTKLYSNPWYSNRVEITEPERIPASKGAEGFNKNAFFLMTNLQTTYDVYYLLLGLEGIGSDKLWINGVYNDSFGLGFGNSDNAYCWQWGNLAMLMPDIVITFGTDCHYTLDTVAHEYTHGIEKSRSNMAYVCESGAIMEALSDIFGEIVEDIYYQRNGIGHANWRHSSYRNIQSPEDSRQPAVYNGKYYKSAKGSTFMNDHGYVHNNSTVISHAAYLMWNGINGTEEKKLSTEELAKLWYRAMLMMPSDCNFATCRTLVELAAQSMGLSDKKQECVAEAFDTVGIPTNGVPIYTVQSPTELSVFDFEQKLCKDYKIKISPAIISADGAHYIGATHEYYVENREYNTLNLSQGLYAIILEDAGNTNNKFGSILIVTDSEDKKSAISIYTDFGWSSAVLDAYKETCDFYVKWVDGGGHAWRRPSDDYVETYELGNVRSYTTDYFEKHCRTYDDNITTVAQLKEGLNSHFAASYADDFFKRLDPVEDNGRLYTYYEGPWGSGWESVDKIESIEKTGDHTCVLTVSGNANGERLFGKIACEYKDGQYLFYPSVEYLYDEDGDNALPGEFAFFLASDADLSLPLEGTSAAETTEPSTTEPEAPESGGNATGMSYEEARSIYLDYFRNIDLESLRVPFSPYTDETVQVFDFAHYSKEDYAIQSMLADIGNDGSYELLLTTANPKESYSGCSLLFIIRNGEVVQVLSAYISGGTMGGEFLRVEYDTSAGKHMLTKSSHWGYGAAGGSSGLTVYTSTDQGFTELEVLTCTAISNDPVIGNKVEADKIRTENPYALEIDGYVKSYTLNDSYISEEEYEKEDNKYIAPIDDNYDLKDASFENLIP